MANTLANHLYNLVNSNIYASTSEKLTTALRNRFIGFRAEIELQKFFRDNNTSTLEGGYIIPLRDGKNTTSAPIYFTVDSAPISDYRALYQILNRGDFSKLIYIRYDNSVEIDTWAKVKFTEGGIEYPLPNLKIYDFQKGGFTLIGSELKVLLNYFTPKPYPFIQNIKLSDAVCDSIKNYLVPYSSNLLLNLYVSRLVFDGLIGLKYYKGIPSDIDSIRQVDNNVFRFYEVKEKDLSKTKPIGFGIDVQRLKDCLYFIDKLGIEYKYIVRHVDNQTERNFVGWKHIDFKKFDSLTDKSIIKEGGTGMNTFGNPDNPTVMVELENFESL